MKPTDEQLREIGETAWKAMNPLSNLTLTQYRDLGRAAFEASCKIALAEPTDEEVSADYICWGSHNDADRTTGWNRKETLRRFQELFANRLRSLCAPDPDEPIADLIVAGNGANGWTNAVREAFERGKKWQR